MYCGIDPWKTLHKPFFWWSIGKVLFMILYNLFFFKPNGDAFFYHKKSKIADLADVTGKAFTFWIPYSSSSITLTSQNYFYNFKSFSQPISPNCPPSSIAYSSSFWLTRCGHTTSYSIYCTGWHGAGAHMKHGRHVRCQLDVLDGVEVRLGFLHVLAAMSRWGGEWEGATNRNSCLHEIP